MQRCGYPLLKNHLLYNLGYLLEVFSLSKYRKLTVMFCLIGAASMMFGQAGKTSFTYALLIGYFSGLAFSILAFLTAIKAYVEEKKQ